VAKKDQKNEHKVVDIETVRKGKKQKGTASAMLSDTHLAARAIQNKTCLMCQAQKLCVNKTGLCASCYSTLNPREKRLADREAAHKIIEVKVTDDRWKDTD
jgi:hypothetical protein